MQSQFLGSIKDDNDLTLYENYLNSQRTRYTEKKMKQLEQKPKYESYLDRYKGKNVKLDIAVGGSLISRIGILFEIDKDYLMLKLNGRNPCDLTVKKNAVIFISEQGNSTIHRRGN